MNRSQIQISALALLMLLLTPALLFGQSEKGTIVGVVSDSKGALVQGATVTITNLSTDTSQTITTNDEGLFASPFLVPATYKVSVTAPGFSTMVVNEVVVSVGARTR